MIMFRQNKYNTYIFFVNLIYTIASYFNKYKVKEKYWSKK